MRCIKELYVRPEALKLLEESRENISRYEHKQQLPEKKTGTNNSESYSKSQKMGLHQTKNLWQAKGNN